jgi:nucleotide-binding universal stress UspA family protein
MSIAALMVHFDAAPSSYQRLRLAADLAVRLEAGLIGIAGRSYLPPFLANGEHGPDSGHGEQQEMTRALAEIREQFHAATPHVAHTEWRGAAEDVTNLVAREARAADLVIIGCQQGPWKHYYGLNAGVAVLRAGRPVLVVPDGFDAFFPHRVMLAWKDARESRRAVRDAIPLMQRAQEVMIVEVCEHGTEMQSQQNVNDLCDYLVRHDIAVTKKAYLHTELAIADELMRFAEDERADLIVAGAYGHSPVGEWMFGGVTRGLLRENRICCLFSH